jgi:hypothetical protein
MATLPFKRVSSVKMALETRLKVGHDRLEMPSVPELIFLISLPVGSLGTQSYLKMPATAAVVKSDV